MNDIEGIVYRERRFIRPSVFAPVQMEAVTYSLLFGATASWLLL